MTPPMSELRVIASKPAKSNNKPKEIASFFLEKSCVAHWKNHKLLAIAIFVVTKRCRGACSGEDAVARFRGSQPKQRSNWVRSEVGNNILSLEMEKI
ncbi:hypothetical protein TIFTF001_034358 [Ficus carica]|uniref:Uncharacterized protein n=1 Tax=Ficus carica TaxID=3494 RepID=A0AA88E3K8_FICCA|nr:hypothetical protein TIFTF001_034358 [Ficus carica]